MVPKLAIAAEELAEVRIQILASRVHEGKEEMAKVQLELNLQISELQLKVQPSTPPEVKEKDTSTSTKGIADTNSAVKEYTKLFESFKDPTTLHEEPDINHLEIEGHELQ